jgi:hypothetical protein
MELYAPTNVLAAKGVAAVVWRVDIVVPICTERKRISTSVADGVWKRTSNDDRGDQVDHNVGSG